ncbi:MAG: rod shape-determining protein [Planctomycetota bacterium]|nr:MAG: rod shape-determining protein [Planctomycetota bacterium]
MADVRFCSTILIGQGERWTQGNLGEGIAMISLIDRVIGVFSTDMGIDLGTCNTLVCVRGAGIVLNEPSVVAVKKGTNQILMNGQAVGSAAKEMLGKCPGNIEAIRPMKDGVIADFDITEAMIKYFIQKIHKRKGWFRPRVIVAHPSGITGVEKRAVLASAERAGARQVFLVPEPIASGIGVGLPIQEPRGSMIVDIGGGTSEIAVLSLGAVVACKSIRVAGDELNDAIMKHCKENYNLYIGENTAEKIKLTIGSVAPLEKELTMEVRGRDVVTAMPRCIIVSSAEVRSALSDPIMRIVKAIKETLELIPPEISADLVESGITLAGGGALLRGIKTAITREIDIPVVIADDPLTAVARGTGVILDNLDRLRDSIESSADID